MNQTAIFIALFFFALVGLRGLTLLSDIRSELRKRNRT